MKLAIVGSRDYPDLAQVRFFVRALGHDTVVITGGEPLPNMPMGVDETATDEARACGLGVIVHAPDYRRHPPRRAPRIRNELIVAECYKLVAFQAHPTPGTSHAIQLAVAAGKLLRVFKPGDAPWEVPGLSIF